jgi:autoinducer 2 (AI-2) kinase
MQSISDIREQIVQINHELYQLGLVTAMGGNISARCDDRPDEIWITPSRVFKGSLTAEMLVRINLESEAVKKSSYRASVEKWLHCAIFKNRPDINAVVHAHPPKATLMVLTHTRFLPISIDSAIFGDIPVIPFVIPGTEEFGRVVAGAIGEKGSALLMQNHGLVTVGNDLRQAANLAEAVEETAAAILTCKAMGVEPEVIPGELVKKIREIGH